jgi:hypothetical protein
MSKLSKRTGIYLTLTCVGLLAPNAGQAIVEFGKQGQPVKLVVGYQPYYTEAWSSVVINGKQLWEEAPAGGFDRRVPGRTAGRHHRQRDDIGYVGAALTGFDNGNGETGAPNSGSMGGRYA